MAISTNGVVLTRLAGALYNQQLSASTYTEVLAAFNSPTALNTLANYLVSTDFASKTDLQVATTLVTNLSLTAVTGLNNWIAAQLTAAGAGNKGAKIISLLNDFSNMDTTDATYGSAVSAFNTKIDVAQALSQTSGNTGGTFASAGTTTSAQSFALSANADTGTSFTGGAGNDSFNATIATDRGTGTTYTPGDNLNGGAGTDTLIVSVSGTHSVSQSHSVMTLSNIEKVLVSNFETVNANTDTFDASLWAGVTNIGITSSSATGDVLFTNVPNIVSGEMAGSGDLTVTYQSTFLTGTADSINLNLSGATSAASFTTSNGGTGYAETINIASGTSSNSITLADNRHKTINVTGDKNLTLALTDGSNSTTAVAATAFTGALTLSGLGTTNINISGGTGADTVTAANIDANDTINGGEGTDTLKTGTALTAANAIKITNFEVLEVTANGTTQIASAVVGATTLSVNDATAGSGNGTITFSGLSATQALAVKAVGDATDDVAATIATNTTADSIAVSLGTTTAGVTFDVLTLNDYETITVNNSVAASVIGSLTSSSATRAVINGTAATTITAIAAANLATIDGSASTANLLVGATGKASSITGGSGNDNLTGSTVADTISGGTGNDTLDGGTGNDSISGGDGIDSITGGTGNDTVDGGAGNDIFFDAALNTDNFSGGDGDDTFTIATFSTLTSADTVSGGNGADTISFSQDVSYDFTADVTILTNVSSVETIKFTGLAGDNDTVTLNDGIVSAAGGTLTLVNGSASSTTFNASAVLASSSKVVLSSDATGGASALIYSIGNGIDQVSLGTSTDTVTVSNLAYLSASDTLSGGAGADTLSFTRDVAGSNTITAAQLTNVTGFETFSINNPTNGTAVNYSFTLTDAVVGGQVGVGSTFTVTRDSGDTGTTTLNGSAVTTSYKLALTGGAGNDTLTGGSGDDTITGGTGTDSLTGGSGNDSFVLAITTNDTITDFGFGTSTTTVDILSIGGLAAATIAEGAIVGTSSSAAGDYGVIVLTDSTYATAALASAAANLIDNSAANEEIIIIYQNGLGNVTVVYDADADTDGTSAETVIATLSGLTISSIASLINAGDFVFGA